MCSAQIQFYNGLDEDPAFLCVKNGNVKDLDEYVCRNFNYPRDQMLVNYTLEVRTRMLITSEGRVLNVEILPDDRIRENDTILQSMRDELTRVLRKTIWKPGKNNGNPVSSWFYKRLLLVSKESEMPHNAEDLFRKIKKYIGVVNKKQEFGMPRKELDKRLMKFDSFYNVFPLNVEINIPYAKMNCSIYNFEKALESLTHKTDSTNIIPQNIKSKIFSYFLAAILYEKEGKTNESRVGFSFMNKVINQSIREQNLGHSIIKEDEAYIRRHTNRLVVEAAEEAERNTTDIYYKDKMAHEWSYSKMNSMASDMTSRRLLDSNSYLHNMELLSILWSERKLTGNDYKLLAIRSLATRLSEGEDMEKAQLISMIADEKVSDKVRKQLQGLYDQVEALRLSHDEIVNNVIMYAPVQDPAKTKEENKAAATEFYRIRDAINNVYHLDWLEKK